MCDVATYRSPVATAPQGQFHRLPFMSITGENPVKSVSTLASEPRGTRFPVVMSLN